MKNILADSWSIGRKQTNKKFCFLEKRLDFGEKISLVGNPIVHRVIFLMENGVKGIFLMTSKSITLLLRFKGQC